MLGGRGANHKASDERVFIKLDEPAHPLTQPFGGQGFEYRDEFFRVHEPYSRKRLRVLLSIDTEKTDLSQGPSYGGLVRPDNDYALAWARRYGRGRTFYCTIAHNPRVFWDPKMLQFYLAATQFVLGDLPAPTTPSGRLTPALRAQEELGWRLGLGFEPAPNSTLFECIDKAAELGLLHVEASDRQGVSRGGIGTFGPGLSEEDQRKIRLKLDAAGVSLPICHVHKGPETLEGWRSLFEFSRGMGLETLVAAPPPPMLDSLEKLCDEHEINLALHGPGTGAWPHYPRPADVLKACAGRGRRIGAWVDFGLWVKDGLAPLEVIRTLKERLFAAQLRDLNSLAQGGHYVPWGTGAGQIKECLEEIRRLRLQPTLFSIDCCQVSSPGDATETAENIRFFNKAAIELAKLNVSK
jgi:sugar phosphate isomerase/epimerase